MYLLAPVMAAMALVGASAATSDSIDSTAGDVVARDTMRHHRKYFDVPGSNPFTFCQDPTDYPLQITNMTMFPEKPQKGHSFNISVHGTLRGAPFEPGNIVKVKTSAMHGLVYRTERHYICDMVQCPTNDFVMHKKIELPKHIGVRKLGIKATVHRTAAGIDEMTCLEGTVNLKRH